MTIRRSIVIIGLMLVALVGGTAVAIKVATDHLLYQSATTEARNWARYLAENVKDLEQIVAGEQPSSTSMAFFQWAQQVGLVFRYEIFNRHGYAQLISDRSRIALVDVSEFSADAARSAETRQPIVAVKEGKPPALPSFFAQAYVPVVVDGRPIAVVAAYVDQTEQRNQFYKTFIAAAVALCLLTALAFVIPAIAWYRRTKEKQRADEKIRYLAHHDVMTGLDNRHRLTDRLQRALIALPSRGGKIALHYIDLDRFKDVNDTLGHLAGDRLIQAAAERLRSVTRKEDVVARIGGDEFTIVQLDAFDRVEAEALAHRVITTLRQPFAINGQMARVGASVGIAMAPTDAIDMAHLMQRADLALYKAKADGRNCVRFFTAQLDVDNQARLELENALRDAVANDGFDLHFQPVYDSATKGVVGFEALLRLRKYAGDSAPSPTVFIPVAEELGLIHDIARWVLGEACKSAATWPEHLTVAVNLSPAQFAAGNVCELVASALKESGLRPQRLELEITEGLLLGDTDAVIEQLGKLKELGVSIVMDDFGTGYSSLSYLWRFHFDKIKIDQSFMTAFDNADANAETIIKTIIALGRSLHMQVTVEGVETDPQANFVRGLAADQVQGFYFGRPVPATEIAASVLAGFKGAAEDATTVPEPEKKLRMGA